jgi:hypothetical protein
LPGHLYQMFLKEKLYDWLVGVKAIVTRELRMYIFSFDFSFFLSIFLSHKTVIFQESFQGQLPQRRILEESI